MRTGISKVILLAVLVAPLGAAGCHEPPGESPDAGDAGDLDARVPDARVSDARTDAGPDAQPDGSPDGRVIQHSFCNDPFFKLPIDGQTERTAGIELDRTRVVWSKHNFPASQLAGEVYLLDLTSCIERQLTLGSQAAWVDISGSQVVWTEFADSNGPWCTDLYGIDLTVGFTERLTQTPGCELEPRTNGRYVVYRWVDTIDGPPAVSPTLRLLDITTGDDTEIWHGSVDSYDLDGRYVVWLGYNQEPQAVGRDLYSYDLQTGVTRHLDFTYERYQWWVYVWDGWVTIQGTDDGLYDPLNWLQLYHLETEELRTLVVGDYATSAAWIGGGLLAYNTSAYSAQPALNPSDVEVYEVESQFNRRLTSQGSNLRVRGIVPPYLLLIDKLFNPSDPYMNDFYIANLEALGVLDPSGSVIPGGPVIDPP